MVTTSKPPKIVEPVDRDALDQSIDSGNRPDWPTDIKQAELQYVRHWRRSRGDAAQADESENLLGLALSGGGIRSATFSLGVMQALAARGLLRKVDFLSTVSGGGYIGSALTWLLSRKAEEQYHDDLVTGKTTEQPDTDAPDREERLFGLDADNFPFGTDDPAPERERKAGRLQRRMLQYLRDHGYYLTPGAGIDAFSLIGIVLRGTFLNVAMWMPVFVLFFLFGMWFFGESGRATEGMWILPHLMAKPPHTLYGFELFLRLGSLLLLAIMAATLVYAVITWFRRGPSLGIKGTWYRFRRFAEHWSAVILATILLLLVVGSLPAISFHLHAASATVGPLAMLSGIGAAIRDFIKPKEEGASGAGILAPVAAGLFLFGGFLVAYDIAHHLVKLEAPHELIMSAIVATSLFFGWLVNLNYISIHRYYRDRLMETFMPDIVQARQNRTGAAFGANKAMLCDLTDPENPRGPYHIVNTNVVLVDSPQRVYRNRGGDSFMLSPLYCGSNATGWCPTKDFMGGKMTLATAMAISGAAANPNTGVGGVGLTRNRVVSFVMSLLNLRLGYWAGHPRNNPRHVPNHIHPGLYAFGNVMGADRLGFSEERSFLTLSDGGHFENTGIYELIRRHVRLIIACDGGADSEFSFSDFQTTIRRIEDDFGTRIHVLDNATPDQVVPVAVEGAAYPKDAKFAEQGHMIGCIRYPDGSKGWLIFLKTALIRDLSFKVKGYAAQNPEFPDQSTIDQFFDEVQFEAYRELGYRLADKMLISPAPAAGQGPEGDRCQKVPPEPDADTGTLGDFIREYSDGVRPL
jgi:predicted acylesterase/phospholipase RssA